MPKKMMRSYHHSPTSAERRVGLWAGSAGHYIACDHVCPVRIRQDSLLIYCVAGRGTYGVGDKQLPVEAGQIFAALPGLEHHYQSDTRAGWDIWFAHFDGDLAERLLDLSGFSVDRAVATIGVQQGIVSLFARLCSVLKKRELHAGLEASAVLFRLLLGLQTVCRLEETGTTGIEASLHGNPESVEQMAQAAGMSKYHFIRVFRKATGITPWRYILARRINRAKALLVDSDQPVKQVAYQVGFTDADYFSRLFRQETGSSATAFRSQHRVQ